MVPLFLCVLLLGESRGSYAQDRGASAGWSGVATRVRNGEWPEAVQELERLPASDRQSASGRYLAARLAEVRSRAAEVVTLFAGDFHDVPEEVRNDIARRRIRALAQTDQCDQAATLAGDMESVDAELHGALAECAMRRTNLDLALREANRAVDGARGRASVPYRILRADVRLQRGDRAQAIQELVEILRTYPAHRKASDVQERLSRLSALPTWTPRERLLRAEAFSEARQHGRAVEELRGLSPPRSPRADRARFLHVQGMALFGTRHSYEEAARVLSEAAAIPSETSASDAFHAARALARSGREPAAVTAYQRFVREHASDSRASEAAYLAATSLLRRGESSGVRAMNQFLRGPFAALAPDSAREGRSELAFYDFHRRAYADAARAFLAYAELGTSGMVRGRGLYWAARSQMLAGNRNGAVESYRAAILAEPLHWYGQLARAQLVALGIDPGPPFAAAPSSPVPATPVVNLPEAAAFYARLGLVQDARDIVRANESRIRSRAPHGRELETLVAAYASIDDADRTYHLTAGLREALAQPYRSTNAWVWNAAYPRPWQPIVDRESRARHVPEDYLYAIMRQESGYDPNVVSSADAIGLLQLLPSTAARVGEGIHERVERHDLFSPAINIRISAVYTGNLYRTFAQQAPLSIGAYNAGAPRMQRWLESTDTDELDLFVERISVEQTRNYIRRVMSHWARYQYMRNPSAGWPTLFSLRLDRSHVDRAQAAADR